MNKSNAFAQAILRWPVAWGSLASLAFYAFIDSEGVKSELTYRYFESHPVEYASMVMFFSAIAALIFKSIDVVGQRAALGRVSLGEFPTDGQPVADAGILVARLNDLPAAVRRGYLASRLGAALDYVVRKGSADELDEHLRYAADMDDVRKHGSYAMVRIVIWAIPILGFLGTVLGITMALSQLGPKDLEKSLPEVLAGLTIAFDTTALALALSMVLMFAQYFVDGYESGLLSQVDDRTNEELVGRFEQFGAASDPQAAAVKRMAEVVIKSCERLVEKQTDLWRGSIDSAHQQWTAITAQSGQQLETSLAAALDVGLKQHAAVLAQSEQELARLAHGHWQAMRDSLAASSETLTRQQSELIKQGQVLLQVVEATDQLKQLESALNRNLAALSNEHNFEETVLSLSAAIQLLTSQLHGAAAGSRRVNLKPSVDAKAA